MNKQVEKLHDELLDNISDSYQKTEGFPVWDILRAFAYGLKRVWDKAFEVEAELDVDNLKGEKLDRFVYQRKGIIRKPATKAVGKITVVTGVGVITKGSLFASSDNVQFEATETVDAFEGSEVPVMAVIGGVNGNLPSNTITYMPVTIAGISEVTNAEPTTDGYDEENDDALRERYYEALREPATSGNVYHYKRWAKEVEGVGDAKVFSLWQGDNTVQVVIIDSEKKAPNAETIARCQDYIDPGIAGSGEGEAPVGAYCTVTGATTFVVNVEASILFTADIESIRNDFEEALTKYLASIAFKSNYVSVAKIGDILLDVDGVEDYDELLVNGGLNRVVIPEKSVAVLGGVVLNVAE